MGFFLFWRQMCRTNKIHVSSSVYTTPSYFSAPEGQRFESSRSPQEQHLMGCCSFCFAWILWGSKRADSNSPCPAAWRIPSGALKNRIAMYFCNAIFVLMLFRFRIILVAYHLRHQCIALLPVDHFSTDLWCFA